MTEREALIERLKARADMERACGNLTDNPMNAGRLLYDAAEALATPAPVAAGEGMVRRLLDDLEALEPHLLEQVCYSEPGLKLRAMLSAAPAQSPVSEGAEIERLRADAERWRAFISSARFRCMGSANFDHSAYPEVSIKADKPAGEWLHFGIEVWDKHPAGEDEQGTHGRNLLMAYVEHRRAALTNGGDNA